MAEQKEAKRKAVDVAILTLWIAFQDLSEDYRLMHADDMDLWEAVGKHPVIVKAMERLDVKTAKDELDRLGGEK